MEERFISRQQIDPDFFSFQKDWDYHKALEEQLLAFQEVAQGKVAFKFLCGEHKAVYSMGRSLKKRPVSQTQIPFVMTERGGRLMYHGPGQLTLYPIFKIRDFFSGPRDYSKSFFDTVVEHFILRHSLRLECMENGLWFKGKKVGFMGLRIEKGITYHGLSLNYQTDLSAFKSHSPCSISGDQVGNLEKEKVPGPFSGFSIREEALEITRALAYKLTK